MLKSVRITRTDFIRGIGKRDEQFIMMLDVDRVFSSEELAVVEESSGKSVQPETGSSFIP